MRGFGGVIGLVLVLVVALVLGAGGAVASPTTPTSILVEVIGGGNVTSTNVGGIDCGKGDLACYATFSETSGTITLKAVADTGWNAPSWTACPSASGAQCQVTLDAAAHRVEVQFTNPNSTPLRTFSVAGTGAGKGAVEDTPPDLTTSPPTKGVGPNIDCAYDGTATPATTTGKCSWTVIDQSTITVIQTAGAGYYLGGWGGNCSSAGSGLACSVYMTGDAGVVANFGTSIATQALTAHVVGNGTVSGGGITCGSGATCDHDEPQGNSVTLSASAGTGYLFTGWSGACTGNQSTCVVDMSAARDATATFAQVFNLSVTASGSGTINGGTGFGVINCNVSGTVTCKAPEPANGTVTLTEVPATGSTFVGWGGACSGLVTACTVSMNTDRSVTASFIGMTIPLTISVSGNGTVTGPGISCTGFCSSNQTPSTTVTLSAVPQSGGTFNGWGGACAGSGTSTTCTVTVAASQSVSASFGSTAPSTFPLSVTVAGNGSVTGGGISCGKTGTACNISVSPGTSVTLKATPTNGAKFVRWTGDCVGTTASCVLVVGQARSVVATFSGGTSGGGGGGSAGVLKSLGAPTVTRSAQGYRVTLRFSTSTAGMVTAQGLRAGQVTTSFKFEAPAGERTVGPFPVALPGYYTFKVSLLGTSHVLTWHACLGTCGVHAPKSAGTFTVKRLAPVLKRAGAGWLVTLRFQESKPSGTEVRVLRSTGTLLGVYQFAPGAGNVSLRRLVLSPGSYRLRLTATDAYGRVRTLVFNVALHA